MSEVEEAYVTKPELYALEKKVDEGFLEMRKNQCRTETQFLEVRKELAHHSELLTELKQGQDELRKESAETRNMVKQILAIASSKV